MDGNFCLSNNSSLIDLIANERQQMEMVAEQKVQIVFYLFAGFCFWALNTCALIIAY